MSFSKNLLIKIFLFIMVVWVILAMVFELPLNLWGIIMMVAFAIGYLCQILSDINNNDSPNPEN